MAYFLLIDINNEEINSEVLRLIQKKKKDSDTNKKIELTEEIKSGFKDFLIFPSMRTSKFKKQKATFDKILEYFIKLAIQIKVPNKTLLTPADFV